MHRRRFRGAGIQTALLLALGACEFDATTPEDLRLRCSADSDCVSGQFCREDLGRCVLDEDLPPGPINDLAVLAATATSLTLGFTAVGDDGFQTDGVADFVLHLGAKVAILRHL